MEHVEPGEPDIEGKRWFSASDGVCTGFGVATVNRDSETPEDYEVEFGPEEEAEAEALAAEFNRYEFQGPLDPEFTDRRDRLKKLVPDFGSFYFEGPPEARWPVRPGRYLVRDGGVGWHPEDSDSLVDSLDDLKSAIAKDETSVYSVIDLDSGDEVPFERQVSVALYPAAVSVSEGSKGERSA
jgi:hypothetical protein